MFVRLSSQTVGCCGRRRLAKDVRAPVGAIGGWDAVGFLERLRGALDPAPQQHDLSWPTQPLRLSPADKRTVKQILSKHSGTDALQLSAAEEQQLVALGIDAQTARSYRTQLANSRACRPMRPSQLSEAVRSPSVKRMLLGHYDGAAVVEQQPQQTPELVTMRQLSRDFELQVEKYFAAHGVRLCPETQLQEAQMESGGRHLASPDLLVLDELHINGVRVAWVECKRSFGSDERATISGLVQQATKYRNLWGEGAFVFKAGFSADLVRCVPALLLGSPPRSLLRGSCAPVQQQQRSRVDLQLTATTTTSQRAPRTYISSAGGWLDGLPPVVAKRNKQTESISIEKTNKDV